MLKIGITGGIGSGKSTVARVFETLGIPVYNADDAAKRLMQEDPEIKKQLISLFGETGPGYQHKFSETRKKLKPLTPLFIRLRSAMHRSG
jgi:dephospho-CoA kinase